MHIHPTEKSLSLTPELVRQRLEVLPAMDPMLKAFFHKVELRESAVLLPLQRSETGQWRIVLTRRSQKLSNHKGEIAFPGGKVDLTDVDVRATAIRETEEEIGIPRQEVEILGRLPESFSIAGFQIAPIVGMVPWDAEFTANPGELDEVFTVPLDDLLQPELCVVMKRVRLGEHVHKVYSFPWQEGYNIWGATARMLKIFLEALAGPLILNEEKSDMTSILEFPRPRYWIANDPFPESSK